MSQAMRRFAAVQSARQSTEERSLARFGNAFPVKNWFKTGTKSGSCFGVRFAYLGIESGTSLGTQLWLQIWAGRSQLFCCACFPLSMFFVGLESLFLSSSTSESKRAWHKFGFTTLHRPQRLKPLTLPSGSLHLTSN